MKIFNLILQFTIITATTAVFSQEDKESELFKTLQEKDSLIFNEAFNKCDISHLYTIASDDFEFYHDQGGITSTKSDFIKSVENNICSSDYKPKRKLIKESLEVYPLKKNGVLYGAVQTGVHKFYILKKGEEEYSPASIAKFTHLWLLDNNEWKLSRVLSYDHQSP
ncbi:nuclear transport factor 2 family protein [Abyssalbus ytuae]|uniref:Nuclear transport factor 2 family protein n=1 Tax=Abyssalbus ytuae TaxID=2926907 RepID=A0A9E6ZZJ8_9FLAO|nr:nuclear transport factor 2 family protein [Abyssalbus ytuae]UOB18052.1 nuclear transport factor 2 family protein [Abyssalbus ytuae]